MGVEAEFVAAQQQLNRKIAQMARRAHEAIHESAESSQRLLRSPLSMETMTAWLRVRHGWVRRS